MKYGPTIRLTATLLLGASLALAQNPRKEQRAEQRNERREARQQAGFHPPEGKNGGFGPTSQRNQQQPQPPAPRQNEAAVPQQPRNGNLRVFGPGPHAGDWLRRNRGLPLNQQMQQLQNDPAYRNLPPEQQKRFEERLQRFNAMPPEQQDRFLNRMDEMEHLPPDARQEERELYRRYNGLPFSRQQAVRNGVRELMQLPPEQRQEQLSSPEYRQRFTDTEREIISQQLQLPRPGQRPTAPPENDDQPQP